MEGFKGLLNQREADQKMPNLKAIEEKIYSDEDVKSFLERHKSELGKRCQKKSSSCKSSRIRTIT